MTISSRAVVKGIGKFKINPFRKDGKILISKVSATGNLKESILNAVNLIGGFNKVAKKGR